METAMGDIMAKLLVIRARPLTNEASRSMTLTDEFVRVYTDTHSDDDVIDMNLYEVAVPEIDLDLLNGWSKSRAGIPFAHLHEAEQNKMTLFDHYTSQFLSVDKIVVANPLWNLQVPTRLKAWIDTISVAGKTFEYNEQGVPVGLVKNKKALHIQTAGGLFDSKDPASVYVKTLFGFLGFDDFQQISAEGMDHDPGSADAIMAAATEKVRSAAAQF